MQCISMHHIDILIGSAGVGDAIRPSRGRGLVRPTIVISCIIAMVVGSPVHGL